MANYVIGDLQGCFNEFQALLKRVDFSPSRDHLYLVGDIVARGPDSLECLRYLYQHAGSVSITLGNHDLHLLACYHLHQTPNPKDKLGPLFQAKDRHALMSFLQAQPLAIWKESNKALICHAGLTPQWSLQQGLEHAAFATRCYQSEDAPYYFANMYQNHPASTEQIHDELDRFIYTVNSFTRMRFTDAQGRLDMSHKGKPEADSPLQPWFTHPGRMHDDFDIFFGHWAALEGKTTAPHIYALDTGCVWGNAMTLLDLTSKQRFIQTKL